MANPLATSALAGAGSMIPSFSGVMQNNPLVSSPTKTKVLASTNKPIAPVDTAGMETPPMTPAPGIPTSANNIGMFEKQLPEIPMSTPSKAAMGGASAMMTPSSPVSVASKPKAPAPLLASTSGMPPAETPAETPAPVEPVATPTRTVDTASSTMLSEMMEDMKKGATVDQLLEAYPELNGRKDTAKLLVKHKELLQDMKDDIDKGATWDEIHQAYPEIYGEQKVLGVKPSETNSLQTFITPMASFLRGLADQGQGIGEFIGRMTGTMSEEEIKKSREFDRMMHERIIGANKDTMVAKGSELAGQLAGQMALTAPIGGIAGPAGAGTANVLGRLGVAALKGAATAEIANIASEGKNASAGQMALGAGIGTAFQGISELKGGLYKKAFQQTKKSLAEKGVDLEGKAPGTLVENQNLSPSVKKGLTQIKDKLQNTWKVVEQTADKAGNFEGSAIKDGLKLDMIHQLGFDKLPQDAQSTKDLLGKVYQLVDDYIPDGKIAGSEVVQTIKNLNTTLPDKLVGMGIQNVTSSKGFTQAMEKGLKKALDTLATKGGAEPGLIQKLYQTYGQQKLVESILKDESLRKTLGRQLIGAGIGAGVGTAYSWNDFREGNILQGLAKILAFGVGGKMVMQAANSPDVLMKLGSVVKTLGKGVVQQGAEVLANKATQ